MCFHDELCQVYNALMTALSLLREGSKVTMFFGSRGINAVHKEKVKLLKCLPDQPKEEGEAVIEKWRDGASERRRVFFMLIAEGHGSCLSSERFAVQYIAQTVVDGVKVADPAKYYKETVIPADMNLTF
jgi:predicted peroxiredoxin